MHTELCSDEQFWATRQNPGNVGFYDVTRDGKRFLVNVDTWKEQTKPLMVITNWTAELQNSGK